MATLHCWDDGERVQVIRVPLTKTAVASFTARKHSAVWLDDKWAILTADYLQVLYTEKSNINVHISFSYSTNVSVDKDVNCTVV